MTSATRTPSNRISSLILFATVAAAPFPFGSTDPSAIAFWCIVLGLGVVFASPRGLRREHFPLFGLAGIVILAYAFVLHEQLAARPWIASPHELWREAAEALGIPIAPSVSIARNQPFLSLGAPLANMLAMICSFIVCIDRDRARQLFMVVAWSGAAYAIYGIVTYLVDPTHILWREKIAYRDVLTSTFINRNTAAVYFGSCAILWLLVLSQHLRRELASRGRFIGAACRVSFCRVATPNRSVVRDVASLPRSDADDEFQSRHRALAHGARYRVSRPFSTATCLGAAGLPATLMIGGLIAILFLQFLGGNVSGRFEMQGLSDEGRLDVYRSTLRMIADHPWFGTGLGTFVWSFPAYRSANISMWGIWDRAHSTPLELASDLGLPLAGLITVAWLIASWACWSGGALTRRRDLIIPVGALTVAVLSLMHSCIDFSLQIPGYAIIVFSLVGAGLAQSFSSNNVNNIMNNHFSMHFVYTKLL